MNRLSNILSLENGAAKAMFYGLGMKPEDLGKYIVGIGSMSFDSNPCNRHLGKLQDKCKISINKSDMNGFNFNTIGVSDGITNGNSGMNYSLPSRELIADSIETMVNAHHYDGFITLPGCDKNLPATMMAMGRTNLPSLLVYGGSMYPGSYNNQNVDIVDAFQSFGKMINNEISYNEREDLLKNCCDKGGGGCSGMYTCNSMAVISEVMGLSMLYSSSNPAASIEKRIECYSIGDDIYKIIQANIKPRDIITKESFINAIKITGIMGGSTNAVLHLLAIANEFNIDLTLDDFTRVLKDIPILGNLKPLGIYSMNDIHKIGGTPIIIKYLIENNILDGSAYTMNGYTLKENIDKLNEIGLKKLDFEKQDIFRPLSKPFNSNSHIRIMSGNLCSKGAVGKISKSAIFKGPAKIFENEDSMIQSLKYGNIKPHNIVVIRNQGPKGSPGMPEMLKPSSALVGANLSDSVVLLTDGRFSGGSHGNIIGHITPEAVEPNSILGLIKEDDIIEVNTIDNTITAFIPKIIRTNNCKENKLYNKNSYLNKYRKLVSDASKGCITNY